MISLVLITWYWLTGVRTLTMIALLCLFMHIQQPSIEKFGEEYKCCLGEVRKLSVVGQVMRAHDEEE